MDKSTAQRTERSPQGPRPQNSDKTPNSAKGSSPERVNLLIDLPSKLNTALRTIRLYPPTNPQVQRNINQVLEAIQALLKESDKKSTDVAVSENKLLVDGEQLPEKEQGRPQIQSFITALNTVNVHSLTFHDTITAQDCSHFIQTLSQLNSAKEPTESIAALLEQAGVQSIAVDMKRYVAFYEGEQPPSQEGNKGELAPHQLLNPELVTSLLGEGVVEKLASFTPSLVQEMLHALPQALLTHANPQNLEQVVNQAIQQMTSERMRDVIQAGDIGNTSMALAGMHPTVMARLMDDLPDTDIADEMLLSTLQQMSPESLDNLFTELLARQTREDSEDYLDDDEANEKRSLLERLLRLNKESGGLISESDDEDFDADDDLTGASVVRRPSLERYTDAYALLHGAGLGGGSPLPEDTLERLQNPQWSASVLFTTVQQLAYSSDEAEQENALESFNTLLSSYEDIFDEKQLLQVAQQTANMLISLGEDGLENILGNRLRGRLGSEMYRQIIDALPDDRLDRVIDRQTPQQINRMASAIVSGLPAQPELDEDGSPIADPLVQRLEKTGRGMEIKRSFDLHLDARYLLSGDKKSDDELPAELVERLKKTEWSASVVAGIAQQLADAPRGKEQDNIHVSFNRLLYSYEHLLDKEQQNQLAQQASLLVASMESKTLGKILDHTFKGNFGAELYRRIVEQLSDELMDETVTELDSRQLNRMIAGRIGTQPVSALADPSQKSYSPENDLVLKRLIHTARGPEIAKSIAQTVDARIVEAPLEKVPVLPERVAMRLQQPAWSAPVLVKVAEHSVDPGNFSEDGKADLSGYERALNRYDVILNQEKQNQVATQAGAEIADFSNRELSLILVQKYKTLFADQVYHQIVTGISEKKFKRLSNDLQAISEGRAELLPLDNINKEDVKEAHDRMMQTVRTQKIEKIIAIQKTTKTSEERKRRKNIHLKLNQLLRGELGCLKEKDTVDILSESVQPLLEDQHRDFVDKMLMQLAGALHHKDPIISANAAQILARITEHLAQTGQWQILTRLMPALHQVLLLQKDDQSNVKKVTTALTALAAHYILQEDYVQSIETTNFLRSLITVENKRGRGTDEDLGPNVREAAFEALQNLCTRSTLEHLLERYLYSDVHQSVAAMLLVNLGMRSAEFLLQQLMKSESRFERKRLLALIKQTGNMGLEILRRQLKKEAPWFVTRNIIRLLGEIGDPHLLKTIQPFLLHPDLRVQQEVLNAASKIDNKDLKDFLAIALKEVDDSLKLKVVNQIVINNDERFVIPLTGLLEGSTPFHGKNKEELQVAICKALSAIESMLATPALQRVIQSKNILNISHYNDEVRLAAERALENIQLAASRKETQYPGETASPQPTAQKAAPAAAPAPSSSSVAIDIAKEEQAIFALITQGNREQAKKRLLNLISLTAKAGNFKEAERLRDRIYEIDNMALGEILRAGEIIEDGKKEAIKEEDLEIWGHLTDRLSSEEFQAIYHGFVERKYAPEEILVTQGEKNDSLFFINQGNIKVSHMVGPKELFITALDRGQIAGENFFTPSFWTITLTALTASQVYILRQKTLREWQDRFPGLRAKLLEFYTANNNIQTILEKKGLERRRHQRFTVNRKIQVQPIDSLDNAIGRAFRAETIDISKGGLAFIVRISRQENVRLLLGRRMLVFLPLRDKEQKYTQMKGLVIGVQPYHILENDFSVHFRFDEPMDLDILQNIMG